MKIRRLVASVLSLILFLTFFPSAISPAIAAGGKLRTKTLDLTAELHDKSDAAEGWSWNASQKTLKLNSVNLSVINGDGIILPPKANITASGKNLITTLGGGSRGISSPNGLTITGDGGLSIISGGTAIWTAVFADIHLADLTAIGGSDWDSYGIYCDRNMDLSAWQADITISVSGDVTASSIEGGANVSVKAGKNINVNTTGGGIKGVYASFGNAILEAGNQLNIDGEISVWSTFNNKIQLSGTIPSGRSVRLSGSAEIPAGKKLVNNGTITCVNDFVPYGTFINNGSITPGPVKVTATKIYVNGKDILTAPNHTVQCGSGTAVFTPVDNTLTLNNAAITTSYTGTDGATYGIYADGGFNIVLTGTNTIIANPGFTYGLYAAQSFLSEYAMIRCSGPGTLSVAGTVAGVYIVNSSMTMSSQISMIGTGTYGAAFIAKESAQTWPLSFKGAMTKTDNSELKHYDTGSYPLWTFAGASPVTYDGTYGLTGAVKQIDIVPAINLNFQTDYEMPLLVEGLPISMFMIPLSGEPPYQFTAEGLPEGLTIDNVGRITGTPTKVTPAGTAVITFKDSNYNSASVNVHYAGVAEIYDPEGITYLTLAVKSTQNGNGATTSALLTADQLTDALKNIAQDVPLDITVRVEGSTGTDRITVTLPGSMLSSLGDRVIGLHVSSDIATLSFNGDAEKSILSKTDGADFIAKIEKLSVSDLSSDQQEILGSRYNDSEFIATSLESAGNTVSGLAGGIHLDINYPLASHQSKAGLSCETLDQEGTITSSAFTYAQENGSIGLANDMSKVYIVSYDNQAGFINPNIDVASDAWYYDSIKYVIIHQLMYGTSASTFSPSTNTTRAMIVTILYRMEGKPNVAGNTSFLDVQKGAYYENAVKWAEANKIVSGVSRQSFKPDDILTREQLVTILYRYANYKGIDVSASDSLEAFGDQAQVQPFALQAIKWAVAEKIIQGTGSNIDPAKGAQRAQLAAIFERFIEGNKK